VSNFKTPKITSSAVKKYLFELLVFYLSITFVSHTSYCQQMFKMLSICIHGCSQLSCLLLHVCVNNILLQMAPNINKVQHELIDTVHRTFIQYLLDNTADLIIHYIQVWVV